MPTSKETETTAKKTTTRKTPVRRTAKAKTSTTEQLSEQVASNTRHIQEDHNTIENNSKLIHLLYGSIIILMMIIAGLAFYVGTMQGNSNGTNNTGNVSTPVNAEDVTVTIINDERCTDCPVDAITTQLKALPFLAGSTFVEQDFSEDGVEAFLTENNITTLPAVIFNTNQLNDGGQIAPYLTNLENGEYSLAIGATFDPFAERSENGFLMMDQSVIDQIKENAYYDGNVDAPITWIEYSDVNCFYCKKMAKDGTAETVLAEFPENLNHTMSPFVGVGGAATQTAAEVIECIGMVGGDEAYTAVFEESLVTEKNGTSDLLTMAEQQGVNTSEVQSCIDNNESEEVVASKFALGRDTFGITGTPGNIIINNETGEYELISGAFPAESFIEVINKMLGE